MLEVILYVLLAIYLIVGALIATLGAAFDSDSGRSINPITWVLVTVGWLPWIGFKIAALVISVFFVGRFSRG